MNTRRSHFSSLALIAAATSLGPAPLALAAPGPGPANIATSCAVLETAAPEAAAVMDKIHAVLATASPALRRPERPEVETRQINIVEPLDQSDDLRESVDQLIEKLRDARRNAVGDLGTAVDHYAGRLNNLRTSFDDVDSISASKLEEKAYEAVLDTVYSFQHFQEISLRRCGLKITPQYELHPEEQQTNTQTPGETLSSNPPKA